MPLEDPNVIDMITRPAPGKLQLVITDSGVTPDPEERFARLVEKVETYLGFVLDEDFAAQFPGVGVGDVTFLVLSKHPATPQMEAFSRLINPENPDEAIEVRYEVFAGAG